MRLIKNIFACFILAIMNEIATTLQLLDSYATAQSRGTFADVFGVAPERWSVADDIDAMSLTSVVSVVKRIFAINENLAYILFARFLARLPGSFTDITDLIFYEMHPSQNPFVQGSLVALLASMTHDSVAEINKGIAIFLRECIDEHGVIEIPTLFFVVVKMSQFLHAYASSDRMHADDAHLVVQEILKCTSPQEVKRIFRAYIIVFMSESVDKPNNDALPPVLIAEFIRRCFVNSSDISKAIQNSVKSALSEIFHEYIVLVGSSINKSQSDQIEKFKGLFAGVYKLSNAEATAIFVNRCAIAAHLKAKIRQEAVEYLVELMLQLQVIIVHHDMNENSTLPKKARHNEERHPSQNQSAAASNYRKNRERRSNLTAYKSIAIMALDAAMLDPSESIRMCAMKGLSRAFEHSQLHHVQKSHPELMNEFLKVCMLKCNDVSDRVRRSAIACLADIGAATVVGVLGVEESIASLRRIYLVKNQALSM
jgi:hypothetical protein